MTPCKVRQNAKKSLMAAAQQAVMKEEGLDVTVATSKGTKQEKKILGDEKKEEERKEGRRKERMKKTKKKGGRRRKKKKAEGEGRKKK